MAELIVAFVTGAIAVNVAVAWSVARSGDGIRRRLARDGSPPPTGTHPPVNERSREGDVGYADGGTGARGHDVVGDTTDSVAGTHHEDGGSDDDRVACQYCGEKNHPEFRYCQWCARPGFTGDDGAGVRG